MTFFPCIKVWNKLDSETNYFQNHRLKIGYEIGYDSIVMKEPKITVTQELLKLIVEIVEHTGANQNTLKVRLRIGIGNWGQIGN